MILVVVIWIMDTVLVARRCFLNADYIIYHCHETFSFCLFLVVQAKPLVSLNSVLFLSYFSPFYSPIRIFLNAMFFIWKKEFEIEFRNILIWWLSLKNYNSNSRSTQNFRISLTEMWKLMPLLSLDVRDTCTLFTFFFTNVQTSSSLFVY